MFFCGRFGVEDRRLTQRTKVPLLVCYIIREPRLVGSHRRQIADPPATNDSAPAPVADAAFVEPDAEDEDIKKGEHDPVYQQ